MNELETKDTRADLQRFESFPFMNPEEYEQQEEGRHLWDYLHVVLRRKWTIITFFLVTVVTVLIGTYLITPVYRATVILRTETGNPTVMLFKDQPMVWQQGASEDIETQLRILKSRMLARRVIRAMGLDKDKDFAAPGTGRSEVVRSNPDDAIDPAAVESLVSQINVAAVPKTKLIAVNVDSPNAEFAARTVNELARSYIGLNMEGKFESTQQARDWLEKQLVDLKAKVERSEEQLNRFVLQNKIIRPPVVSMDTSSQALDGKGRGGVGPYDRMDELSSELSKATSDRISKEMILREARSGDDLPLQTTTANNPAIEALRKEIGAKETEYAKLLITYKPDYPRLVKLNEEISVLKRQAGQEGNKAILSLKREYQIALEKENYLKGQIEKYKQDSLGSSDKAVEYQILKRDADTNKELYNGVLQRLKEAGISASMTASNMVILDKADVPKQPYKPDKKKNMLFALLVGTLGGLGLAFFIEYLDNTVKSPDDVEKTVLLSSLGLVPHIPMLAKGEVKPMIANPSRRSKESSLVEAYRSIVTYIQFSSPVRPPKTILLTSARAGEGKTTSSINLATTFANSQGRGIVVDCDLRKPQLHKVFGMDNAHGLSSYLTGHAEIDADGFVQETKVNNLSVITAGIIPPNPSELLSSIRMKNLLEELFRRYEFVILDAPPILGLSDSLILSTLTDGVILVVRAGGTPKESVSQAKKLLRGVNGRILGVILNGVRESDLRYSSYSYYYSYYYSYQDSEDGHGKRKRGKHREKKLVRDDAEKEEDII